MDKKESQTCLQDNSANGDMFCTGMFPKTHVLYTSPTKFADKNMVGYCEAAMADARKQTVCHGQKLLKDSATVKAQKEKAAAHMLEKPPAAQPAPH